MIVGELSNDSQEMRKKFWLENLQLPLEWKELSEEQLGDPSQLLQKSEFDGLLVGKDFSSLFLSHSSRLPAEIVESGLADSLIQENGKIWLRCFFREALKLLILNHAPRLDTHATCYVTGADSMARLCASVAIQLGYRKLVMVSSNPEEMGPFVENIQRLFFGVGFKLLGETQLTLQPNNGSLLLNTLTELDGAVILEDLTYLNFLKKEGLVVDVPLSLADNPLLAEAEHVGVTHLAGVEIWGVRDFLFLKSLLKDSLKISMEDFLSQWKTMAASENQT